MNIDVLLEPISEDAPCGVDMSFSSEFDTVQELRREDDPSLPQGAFVTDRKLADWPAVAELCTRLFESRSKDFRVAGWLLESWSHLHGFAGMADGLLLVEQLCLRFWNEAHPGAVDDELELRVGNLAWILVRTESLTRVVALLHSGKRGIGLAQFEAARVRGEDEAPIEEMARIQKETPREFLTENLSQANRALLALNGLQTTLDTLLDADSPSFVAARKAIEAAIHLAKRLARESGALPAAPAPEAPAQKADAPAAASPGKAVGSAPLDGPPQTRAQALQQLRAVAEFFRCTEPHSPVAYLADKAAQWGEMPLHAWLRAVVKDSGSLTQLEDLLGLPSSAGGRNA